MGDGYTTPCHPGPPAYPHCAVPLPGLWREGNRGSTKRKFLYAKFRKGRPAVKGSAKAINSNDQCLIFIRIGRQQFRRDLVYESKYGPESACVINVQM